MTTTAAALRAAEAIIDGITIVEDERQELAMTIDRETGLPELVACLREARGQLANLGAEQRALAADSGDWPEESGSEIDRIHARIDAALARVDSTEPVR